MKNKILSSAAILLVIGGCDSFLDREPLSSISPEYYLRTAAELETYSLNMYNNNTLPSHYGPGTRGFGQMGVDEHTDNMASMDYSLKYVPGEYKVQQSDDSDWEFKSIYKYNYFLDIVMPRWENGEITGDMNQTRQAIGEVYFFRGYDYFLKMQKFGDYPYITEPLPDDKEVLTEASRRVPHPRLTRLILADLDKAVEFLPEVSIDGKKNRLNKACARLIKSRVALYEATFLKYFKGTAFVPDKTAGWPGAEKDYNEGFSYEAGSIDAEIDWLLGEAMKEAGLVADSYGLTPNSGQLQQSLDDPSNDYYDMFSAYDMSKYPEVLLWRQYNYGLGIRNNVCQYASCGNYRIGLTRGYVDSYLMANGLPIYAEGSGYGGDDYIENAKQGRDGRLQLFLKHPGQVNVLVQSDICPMTEEEPYPIFDSSSEALAYFTGYTIRKGLNMNEAHGFDVGSVVFRAAEAYLNYIEACCEKTGSLDSKAKEYWVKIRTRAKVDTDFNNTVTHTQMEKEKDNDWGACSAGQLVDPLLYNIRRERRCEFLGEGMRYMDLKRWRALDQLITEKYHIEGFKLWGPMQEKYDASVLTYGTANSNVSSPDLSLYLRPYQKTGAELVYDGYGWTMAHYLEPIALEHFLLTSENNDPSTSPIYQNPGWPIGANLAPTNL